MGFTPIIHRFEATTADFFVNAFLVETANGVVAIDATLANSSSSALRTKIDTEIKKPLLAVLLTHGHPDHYTGLVGLTKGLDVPILATKGTLDFAHAEDKGKEAVAIQIFGDDYPRKRVFPNTIVRDGQEVIFDGVRFVVRDYGPGESDADSLWILEIAGVKHVFLGDMIHNHMHCFFRDGHVVEWLKNLDRLLEEFDHTAILYTAHGEPCGTEIVYWHKAYIQAFLGTLKSMLHGRESLTEEEKKKLVARMQSFLPNDKTLFLLTYELDETIRLLHRKNVA
jgi:glyoxylase-like metal-dependent hydrolase (beta-lactamase superfamily II)